MTSPSAKPSTLVVIGAGPAGLTAAYEAARQGMTPLVLERAPVVGGLARTEVHQGYRFDIGGHRFFTKSTEVQSLWEMALGADFRSTPRLSRIFYQGKFYNYPLEPWETLRNLGPARSLAAVLSFAAARARPQKSEDTFEDWVTNRFGRRLYETFFKAYTEKVWGISCREIHAEWAVQRIKDLSFGAAVRQALWPQARPHVKSLIREFRYPRLGPGMMWERFRDLIHTAGGEVRTRAQVLQLHHSGRHIQSVTYQSPDGTAQAVAGQFINTMALDDLIPALLPTPPSEILEAARGLRYRDFIVVGLVLRCAGLFRDNWIYVHSPSVRVGRIQNFGNWSTDLLGDRSTTSLGMEYFCSRGDDLWVRRDDELISLAAAELEQLGLATRNQVVWGTVIRQPKAYPVYDGNYGPRVAKVREYLAGFANFHTIGRNGLHRYNNQDHSMLTGLAAVRRICGIAAQDPWEINADDAYHEEQAGTTARPETHGA